MPERASERPLGIFGGTFDPVHFGHLRLAEEAVDCLGLAGVRWIPAGQPALRGKPQVTARHRLTMIQLATADNPCFEVDPAEVEIASPSYTVPTLERLRRPDCCGVQRPLVLLIGADVFASLPAWHRWRTLFDLAHLAVAHRPGFPLQLASLPAALADCCRERFRTNPEALADLPSGRVVSFAMTQLAISATQIRSLLTEGRSVRYLLPDRVIAHIRNEHLYPEH